MKDGSQMCLLITRLFKALIHILIVGILFSKSFEYKYCVASARECQARQQQPATTPAATTFCFMAFKIPYIRHASTDRRRYTNGQMSLASCM